MRTYGTSLGVTVIPVSESIGPTTIRAGMDTSTVDGLKTVAARNPPWTSNLRSSGVVGPRSRFVRMNATSVLRKSALTCWPPLIPATPPATSRSERSV